MSIKLKAVMTLLGFSAVLICVIITGKKLIDAHEAAQQRAAIHVQNDALKKQTQSLPAQIAPTNQQDVAAKEKSEEKMRKESYEKAEMQRREKERAWLNFLADNPAVQNKRLGVYRSDVAATYGPVFNKLHLSSEQAIKLTDTLIQRRLVKDDLKAIQGNAKPSDPVWAKANKEADAEFSRAAQEVLGKDGLVELKQFERDEKAWHFAGGFAANAGLSGMPISLQQTEALVDAVASAAGTPGKMPANEDQWHSVEVLAKEFLSDEQWEMFCSTRMAKGTMGFPGEAFHKAVSDYSKKLGTTLGK